MDCKNNIIGLSKEEVLREKVFADQKPFRVKQVWKWLYTKGSREFDNMSDISFEFRKSLEKNFLIKLPNINKDEVSLDGTRKWLFGLEDGNEIETVFIPDSNRGTLCISSQVGCTLSCSFCYTGTMKLVRNLSKAEIIGQILVAKNLLNDWDKKTENRIITNIVMMGMGEPLYNYENVLDALKIFSDGDGLSISKRRITLSTSGVVPYLKKLKDDIDVNLAISLHAVKNSIRDKLVPINKKWPIEVLLGCLLEFPNISNARRITFEYVMLKGINDSREDAQELVRILEPFHAKVNLIPFNPWPRSLYESSDEKTIKNFSDIVCKDNVITVTIRKQRGSDISAACGQLKSSSEPVRVRKS